MGRERCLEDRFPESAEEYFDDGRIIRMGDLPVWLQIAVASEAELGQDGRGSPLLTEKLAFFERHEIRFASHRWVWETLWGVLTSERLSAASDRQPGEEGEDE